MDFKVLDELYRQRNAIDTAIRWLETMREMAEVTNGRPRHRTKRIPDPASPDRPFPEVVAMIVRGRKAPIKTAELTSVLEADGVAIPHGGVPKRRYVGMVAGHLAKLGRVKKTAEGWTHGKEA
jgi:hypothetical protein